MTFREKNQKYYEPAAQCLMIFGLIALCRPQVCSSKLLWHVRRWDASGKETCPDPRYYLRKTADKVPATLSPSELS